MIDAFYAAFGWTFGVILGIAGALGIITLATFGIEIIKDRWEL